MARLAILVIPGSPRHVTRRGNGRQQAFFDDKDDAAHVGQIAECPAQHGVEVSAHGVVPNEPFGPPAFQGIPLCVVAPHGY